MDDVVPANPTLALTNAEKNFVANFWYETLDLIRGSSMEWLRANGIEEREIAPFTSLFQQEFGMDGVTRPTHCDVPWALAEEFRARSEALRTLMNHERHADRREL